MAWCFLDDIRLLGTLSVLQGFYQAGEAGSGFEAVSEICSSTAAKDRKVAIWQEQKLVFDWKELTVTEEDWVNQRPNVLRSMLFQLYLVRAFETKLLELKKEGLVHGPVHVSIGQEAVAVGTMAGIRPTDGIYGTHRAHHQFLAKACSYHLKKDYDPIERSIPQHLQDSVDTLLAEIMGLAKGCCAGRGGSMHLCDPRIGVLGTNAIVAGGIPLAGGAAWANSYLKNDNIVVCFFGDGAVNQGVFHEALNLAGLWKLPIIYILENNLYAVATSLGESVAISELSVRAASYGMLGRIVDGMDPLAMKIAIQQAVAELRGNNKPVFIDAKTYRYLHHAGDIVGSAFGYRDKQEEAEWKKRDPLVCFPEKLKQMSLLTDKQDTGLRESAEQIVQRAVEFCTEKDDSDSKVIKPQLIPEAKELTNGLRSDGSEFKGIKFVEPEQLDPGKDMKYVEAIAAVTGRWMEKDSSVFVLGEEVGHMKGVAYQATKGLKQRFPDRVLDTPISEAGFTGLAGGAAMSGLKPIVELMFPDFALVAADQLFNQIGKLGYMYGRANIDVPLVIRTRIASGCGYGGQHSMDPTALFALFSGWRIIAPTTPADYIGLFNSTMQCKDPVLIVEHHELYNTCGLVPDNNLDYFIQMGKAKKIFEGKDVTVLAYSWSVSLVAQAAQQLAEDGISVETIDLRTVSMPDIDYEMIGESLEKTSNVVIVEQSARSNSIGARIGYECHRRFFDRLDAPILTVTGKDVPSPVSKWAEATAMPSVERIRDAIRKSAKR